jgi:hypothetical protein
MLLVFGRADADGWDWANGPGGRGIDEFPALPRSITATRRRYLEGEMALDLFAGIPVSSYAAVPAVYPWRSSSAAEPGANGSSGPTTTDFKTLITTRPPLMIGEEQRPSRPPDYADLSADYAATASNSARSA